MTSCPLIRFVMGTCLVDVCQVTHGMSTARGLEREREGSVEFSSVRVVVTIESHGTTLTCRSKANWRQAAVLLGPFLGRCMFGCEDSDVNGNHELAARAPERLVIVLTTAHVQASRQ